LSQRIDERHHNQLWQQHQNIHVLPRQCGPNCCSDPCAVKPNRCPHDGAIVSDCNSHFATYQTTNTAADETTLQGAHGKTHCKADDLTHDRTYQAAH
jgi:hypothetical protein